MGVEASMPRSPSIRAGAEHTHGAPFDFDVEQEGRLGVHHATALLRWPITLTRLLSAAELSYRRAWRQIRGNRVGIRLICFVRRGSIRLTRPQGVCVISAGEAAVIDTDCPFHLRMTGDEGEHEVLLASVPAHLFLAHLRGAERLASALPLDNPEGQVAHGLLDLLASGGDDLGQATLDPLVISLLAAIAGSARCGGAEFRPDQRLLHKRMADIETYMLVNLADVDLCCEKVAERCGISPRYLCHVLKANNTSFSDMLWKNRLPRARDLLIAASTRDDPIREIAYISGFKSSAHFSRVFKAAYGCPPSVFRARHPAAPVEQPQQPALKTAWDAARASA